MNMEISKSVNVKNIPKPTPRPKSNTPVTIENVAQESGVSISTVSRILTGVVAVSDDKRQAVEKAIDRLGFIPNPIARGLAGGRSMTIGVITQAIDSPFFSEGLRGIEDQLEKVGYTPIFVSGHWNQADERTCFNKLLARRVDGIIIMHGCLSDAFLVAQSKRLPLVVTGRDLATKSLHCIHFDNFEAGKLAAQHLIELGHHQIAFIAGPSGQSNAAERLRGYQFVLSEAGIAYQPELTVQGDFREAQGALATKQLIDSHHPFTAIIACNDQSAYGAALQLYHAKLRIPDDVSLVGFDDLNSSNFTIPPLTTVRIGIYDIGKATALAILELLEGRTSNQVSPSPELIVRESTKRLGS